MASRETIKAALDAYRDRDFSKWERDAEGRLTFLLAKSVVLDYIESMDRFYVGVFDTDPDDAVWRPVVKMEWMWSLSISTTEWMIVIPLEEGA